MGIRPFIRDVVEEFLGRTLGKTSLAPPTMESSFKRILKRGGEIRSVIDIGASDGRWSARARRYFPDAFYLLMEAQPVHEPKLVSYKKKNSNVDFVMAAAGDKVGEIYFDASNPFGGLASHTPLPGNCITVPVTTVDAEVQRRSLRPPFLMKFDTHGFEVPILKGAADTLRSTSLVVMEVYNFNVAEGGLRFYEMCSYLEQNHGLRCVDLADPLYRPKDGVLWQLDLFFAPASDPIFSSRRYS